MPVALERDRADDLAQPVRHNDGQVVERGTQRLGHQFEQVQSCTAASTCVLSVRCLPRALTRSRSLKRSSIVQKQMLRLPSDEASAELGEHAEVEAGIRQLEPERVFPVDAGAHRVSRLPVAEMLEELEHRDQRQPPRRQAGLASGGVKRGEVLVLVKGAELVAQPHDHRALGKGRAGNPRGLGRDRRRSAPDAGSWQILPAR